MTYQVLARKWRPQDFRSLVGQQPIVTALRNALTEDRIAQAYIFSGIRGVGKTTTARVLAKALNCPVRAEQGSSDPCNECRSCVEITGGGDLDVLEVDAATYSKVEQVRELTESLRYAPANDRYKVVVLDEVHRLSRQAFDALLKIVEEPPPHLVFIFATTELDAVPATILSRCQQFQFRRVAANELSAYLRELCERETITASDNALRLVARAAEGSVRDGVALLDQLATFGQGTIEDEAASQLIGGLDASVFRRVLAAILAGDPTEVRTQIHDVEQYGWDPYKVFGQFLTYVRDALHLSMNGAAEAVELPQEESKALAALVQPAGYENVLRILTLLLGAEETVRRSEFGALALEVTLLRAAELPKLTRIEDLLSGGGPLPNAGPTGGGNAGSGRPSGAQRSAQARPSTPSSKAQPPRASAPSATQPASRSPHAEPAAPARPTASPPSSPTPAPPARATPSKPAEPSDDTAAATATVASATPVAPEPKRERPAPASEDLGGEAGDVIAAVRERRPPLAVQLRRANLTFDAGVLTVGVPTDDALLASALERPTNATVLDQAVAALWGQNAQWQTQAIKGPVQNPAPRANDRPRTPTRPPNAQSGSGDAKHPIVQSLLEVFPDGKVESIQPTQETNEGDSVPS